MEKEVHIEEIGNALKLQLMVWDTTQGAQEAHGKPRVLLDTAKDAEIGEAVRALFRTRMRAKKEPEVPA